MCSRFRFPLLVATHDTRPSALLAAYLIESKEIKLQGKCWQIYMEIHPENDSTTMGSREADNNNKTSFVLFIFHFVVSHKDPNINKKRIGQWTALVFREENDGHICYASTSMHSNVFAVKWSEGKKQTSHNWEQEKQRHTKSR